MSVEDPVAGPPAGWSAHESSATEKKEIDEIIKENVEEMKKEDAEKKEGEKKEGEEGDGLDKWEPWMIEYVESVQKICEGIPMTTSIDSIKIRPFRAGNGPFFVKTWEDPKKPDDDKKEGDEAEKKEEVEEEKP